MRSIRILLFVYVLLVLSEGSLRRWILPGFATPLLVIRDPIAMICLFQAFRYKLLKANGILIGLILVSFISFFVAILYGHGNMAVALFGVRILLLHLPLIFVFREVYSAEDIIRYGMGFLGLAIPMLILVIVQFYSSQSSFVNLGVAGDISGAGFGGALGYFRPPGIFSFTNGLASFYGLLGCFCFYGLFRTDVYPKALLYTGFLALIIAIPFTISRTVIFQFCVTGLVFIILSGLNRRNITKLVSTFLLAGLSLMVIFYSGILNTAIDVFMARFTDANETEGGAGKAIIDRIFGGMISAVLGADEKPFFGYGIGMGSNVGAQLLVGYSTFLLDEQEWAKLISELGMVLGLILIFIRIAFVLKMFNSSWKSYKNADILPFLLFSFTALQMLQGNFSQSTALGFAVISAGFLFSSSRMN